ncbi:filamentous hemagglutinin N-terminal domain-containing protein [Scytonema sp. UIC 10036]|uniref:beta strand repeat-containing protein n=1 Tax=Scytonema sp. UIC 10036 TaxID=2304196 RepID=UPI0012DA5970|nr:S-layer family protein [Scytonema sp. UIC 10036]MUG94416.1 filamentous hemagglutinin N-terminal domain-containing protein [Scytonema sp. UIC 10036]
MFKQSKHQLYLSLVAKVGTIGLCTYLLGTNCAPAQELKPAPDNTLGAESSTVRQIDSQTYRIEGGATRGANLFHSFSQFHVGEGQQVYFANPSGIENILSRVTGIDPSKIFGKLGVEGNANLFLMNPNGIIFGQNASLDVRGSFVATTANAIKFGDRGFWSASNPDTPPLLTVNPSAFLFNQINPAPIVVERSVGPTPVTNLTQQASEVSLPFAILPLSPTDPLDFALVTIPSVLKELSPDTTPPVIPPAIAPPVAPPPTIPESDSTGLRVGDGKSLLFVGGNIILDGGSLSAPGGRVELGGLAEAGTVGLNMNGDLLSLSFPKGVAQANVFLSNLSSIDVRASNGGSIAINARSLKISDSRLNAGIGQGLGTNNSHAGDVVLNATDDIEISRSSISNAVESEAVGNSGGIFIKARSLTLSNGTEVVASTFGQGNAGNISIWVDDFISIVNQTPEWVEIFSSYPEDETSPSTEAAIARLGDSTGIFSTVEKTGVGHAGDIEIYSRTLSLSDGAEIQSLTRGNGKAGNIRVNSTESVNLLGVSTKGFSSGFISSTELGATGLGGDITVTTGDLRISNGAVLSARTRSGKNGGNITVNTDTLKLTDGGQILTSSFSSGSAGNITLNATDSVYISGSDRTFKARRQEFGGETVDNDGSNSGLFARVRGDATANAGKIAVNARFIHLDNQGTISTETTSGEGGNIILTARDILLRNSSITATAGTAQADGNGGNIDIDTETLVSLENSYITANAAKGRGGNITIDTQGLLLSPGSHITASSEFGIDGVVEINTPEIDPNRGLTKLPQAPPPDTQVAQACLDDVDTQQSEFIMTGRGGIAPSPYQMLASDDVQVGWVSLSNQEINVVSNQKPRNTHQFKIQSSKFKGENVSPSSNQIVEAQGWVVDKNGEVTLIAQPPKVNPHSSWQNTAFCHS